VTTFGRALRGLRARREERGSVIVEAAIIVPLLMILTFGAIEFGLAFRDSAAVASSTRAGARIASTLTAAPDTCPASDPACTTFLTNVQLSVADSLKDLMSATPETLRIYRATSAGNPVNGCATDCVTFTWNSSSKTWTGQSGNAWTRDERMADACTGNLPPVGISVRANQGAITKLFGATTRTIDHRTAIRLEPPSSDQC
jgi:Flp pilus assembly protein TadG